MKISSIGSKKQGWISTIVGAVLRDVAARLLNRSSVVDLRHGVHRLADALATSARHQARLARYPFPQKPATAHDVHVRSKSGPFRNRSQDGAKSKDTISHISTGK